MKSYFMQILRSQNISLLHEINGLHQEKKDGLSMFWQRSLSFKKMLLENFDWLKNALAKYKGMLQKKKNENPPLLL